MRLTACKSVLCTRFYIENTTYGWRSSMFYSRTLYIFCNIDSTTCSFSIPEIPLISPFVPTNIEFMDMDSFFCKHQSNMFCEHTVMCIAMNDNSFIFWKLSKFIYDSLSLNVRTSIRIRNTWYIYCALNVLLLIFSFWPQIDDYSISISFIHFHSQVMWTYSNCIFSFIVF